MIFDVSLMLARVLVGSVLVLAGVGKLRSKEEFARGISGYKILPQGLIPASVSLIPAAEVLLGTTLMVGIEPRWVSGVACVVFLLFLAALASATVRGIAVTCSCFGLLYTEKSSRHTLARDIVLILLSFLVAMSAPDRFGLTSAPGVQVAVRGFGVEAAVLALATISVFVAVRRLKGTRRGRIDEDFRRAAPG